MQNADNRGQSNELRAHGSRLDLFLWSRDVRANIRLQIETNAHSNRPGGAWEYHKSPAMQNTQRQILGKVGIPKHARCGEPFQEGQS